MATVEVSVDKFQGIAQYHDGMVVTDYVNMIPMGNLCVDRVGETPIEDPGFVAGNCRGSFIDSSHNIYVVVDNEIRRYKLELDGSVVYRHVLTTLIRSTGPVTFCESSLKPSVVYVCDGEFIYCWSATTLGSRQPYTVSMLWLPGVTPTGPDHDAGISFSDYVKDIDRSKLTGKWSKCDSIDWFDNRLVMTCKSENTCYLTCTDPDRFIRNPAEDPWDDTTGGDLWHNKYPSNNGADSLNQVVSYRGQLYFFNQYSIEMWGRTGDEDAPIQSNTTSVIHHGGRNPLIVNDQIFFISKDKIGGEHVATFTKEGFQIISNTEIDKRMGSPIDLRPITQRHEPNIAVRTNERDYFVYGFEHWWRWKTPNGETESVLESILENLSVTTTGRLIRFDEESRNSVNGKRIERYIRDGFEQFQKRVIFRRFVITMDTGRNSETLTEDNKGIYLALSTNNGLSFAQRHYRKLGRSGLNNKVIEWRNLGSGNSVLIEVGTSAPYKLQLYDIAVEAQ
jgi:hypothetical protein